MAPECCCRRPHEFQFRRYRRFYARGAAKENARSPIHTLLRLLHSLARHIACLGVNRVRLALETPSDMAKNVAMAIFQCQRRGKRDSLETHRWYTATELVYTQDDTQDSSDGDRQRAKAFNKLGGSKRSYTSERKENRPWTVMRAATNWATHTTAFSRRLPVVSRTGRTEYQLLPMKASDRGRNVKFLGNNFGCVWWI